MIEEPRKLRKSFYGKGKVQDYVFKQLIQSNKAYIYEVTDLLVSEDAKKRIHYEIFEHKVNSLYNVVSYPRSAGFGVYAWTTRNTKRAYEIFNKINEKQK